jgi:hypothetical protein
MAAPSSDDAYRPDRGRRYRVTDEQDELALELGRPACLPVIDQVGPTVELLVVGQDEPLVGIVLEMPLHPVQLVGPGRRVLPG